MSQSTHSVLYISTFLGILNELAILDTAIAQAEHNRVITGPFALHLHGCADACQSDKPASLNLDVFSPTKAQKAYLDELVLPDIGENWIGLTEGDPYYYYTISKSGISLIIRFREGEKPPTDTLLWRYGATFFRIMPVKDCLGEVSQVTEFHSKGLAVSVTKPKGIGEISITGIDLEPEPSLKEDYGFGGYASLEAEEVPGIEFLEAMLQMPDTVDWVRKLYKAFYDRTDCLGHFSMAQKQEIDQAFRNRELEIQTQPEKPTTPKKPAGKRAETAEGTSRKPRNIFAEKLEEASIEDDPEG